MSAIKSYFTRAHRSGCINLGNEVLVNFHSDTEFYLGFLQDINGDQVFIDFDCQLIQPQWVSIHRVWRHERRTIQVVDDPVDVHVAVRQQDAGPYVFQPALLLRSCSYASQFLCCVSFNLHLSPSEIKDFEVVHSWQVVEHLPHDRNFYRICLLPIKKIVYRSKKLTLGAGIEESHIIHTLDVGFRNCYYHYEDGTRDRVFVRITEGEIMFLIMYIKCLHRYKNECGAISCWLTETTKKVRMGIEKYLLKCLTNVHSQIKWNVGEETEMMLGDLPLEILSMCLRDLDVTPGKLNRVCAVWNALLGDPASHSSLTIDFCTLTNQRAQQRQETEGYHIGRLLHRLISTKTRILALVNMAHRADTVNHVVSLVAEFLRLKRPVLTLIVKSCRAGVESKVDGNLFWYNNPNVAANYFQLVPLKNLCRRLIVCDFIVDFSIWTDPYFGPRMPNYIKRKEPNKLLIKIPIMPLENDELWIPKFKRELVQNCPPVDLSVREDIKRLHAGWVKRHRYPGKKWLALRHLLEFYGPCEATNQEEYQLYSTFWYNLDLREFDRLPLRNLSLTMLARHYIRHSERENKNS
ncbi:uncharacterized protein LOC129598778 isoform X2 [Paramacrobiotus metropolitanus]|uniref:uncharacterized protein LOC129598778 isoform X2 n=1 Tax=Paramacrobiotus metropolitanus TaxID=2943436 RepID=UPI00244588AC|nr:uncharacterized protein LOC129598778 isoform X2 [Paramacrobiotus metropolitanus]